MALAIDASSPAIAVQATGSIATVTTASFTPPAGSVLLIMHVGNTIDPNNPGDPTITDNLGSPLTYTLWDSGHRPDAPLAEGQATTWTANVVTSAAMTITVTTGALSPNRHAALCVQVLTGSDVTSAVTPVGAHGKSSSTSAASIAQNYTASATGGWGFLAVCDWSATGVETAGTGCTRIGSANIGAPDISYGFFRRTTADDSIGVTNTLNATIPSTSTSLRWTYIEIVPSLAVTEEASQPQAVHFPPHLLYILADRQQRLSDTTPDTGATAEIGTTTLALTASGAATKIAAQGGSCSLALRTDAVATKTVSRAGTAEVALRSVGTATKSVSRAGAAELALRSAGASVKVVAHAGTAEVALRSVGTATKSVSRAGTAELALRTVGAALRTAAGSGTATVILLSRGTVTPQGARSQFGTTVVALRSVGTSVKTVPVVGRSVVALRSVGTSVKTVPVVGRSVVALRSVGTSVKRAPAVGRSVVALTSVAFAAKRAPAVGRSVVVVLTGPALSGADSRAQVGVCRLVLLAYMAHECTTHRPHTGTTGRPGSGTTSRPGTGSTAYLTGITARPDTGATEEPC